MAVTREFLEEIVRQMREYEIDRDVHFVLSMNECIDLLKDVAWEDWFDKMGA